MQQQIIDILNKIYKSYKKINAIYLFGSFADGFYRKGSDLDIAILFFEPLSEFKFFSLELEIGEILERKIKTNIDLVILNKAPLPLAFKIIKNKLLFERNAVKRALFESKILSLYYDYKISHRAYYQMIIDKAKAGKIGESR